MKSKSNGKDFCIFALPGLFCFAAVVIIPFLYGIYLTMTDWNGVSDVKNFVGLKNFAAVFQDTAFWSSLLLTFKYVIAVVILVNVIAFLLAYLLTRGFKGQSFFQGRIFHSQPDRRHCPWLHLAVCVFQSICKYRRGYRLVSV